MHILFVSSWFPYPPDNGARMRTYNLLRQIGREHQLSLLSFVRRENAHGVRHDSVSAICQVLGIVPYHEFRSSRPRALLRLFSPLPRSLLETYSPQMETMVREALHRHAFDLVVASEIGPGICTAPYVAGHTGVARVIEDLELSMIWNKVEAQRAWTRRARHRLTWWKLRRYAARLLAQFEGCTVASRQEQALLRSVAPGFEPLAVIPNGLDLEWYQPEAGWGSAAPIPDTLIFPGALTYEANFDAMAFFLRAVYPLIRARRPGTTLRITGRTDGVPVDRLPPSEGVVFTGYLDDVRPTLARSQVCIVPMQTGGGTRLKILEAMALGTPVVSTSLGAQGLEATHGQEILIADEPAAFADAVLGLLSNERLRKRLATNARALVRGRYSWDQIGKELDQFLRLVVQRHGHQGVAA
jgi:sugar transferase (PEP-CTERM/EpsH1 system associated)